MDNFIFIVYTCKKNLGKADALYNRFLQGSAFVKKYNIKPFILYGDTSIDSDYKIINDRYLVLNVEDDYRKTLKMCKTIYSLYPEIKGIFKCDDDIILNAKSTSFFIESLSQFVIHYSGQSCMVQHHNNIATPSDVLYCIGPFYYLSNKSLKIIISADESSVKHIFYEDMIIGHLLNKKLIYPIQSNLYSDDITIFNEYPCTSFHNTAKKNTLFLRIQGGLGNQMFQIASAYGIALKNNMNLFIINNSDMKHHFTHIDDNNYLLNTVFSPFQKIDFNDIKLEGIKHYKEPESDCFIYKDLSFQEDVFLDGYFQNEKYFLNQKTDIINMFRSNPVYKHFIKNLSDNNPQIISLLQNSYFIHVRRGDYLKLINLYGIDYDRYYGTAISGILQMDPGAHFFIVSDDIEYCKKYTLFQNINRSFIELPALETVYFMSVCNKGGICCNSTFSWWGSYLNPNPYKIVTFPSKWINRDWNIDIFYQGSTVIPI